MTELLSDDAAGIAAAAERLAAGGLVAFPTDTVHGVACRAHDEQALARLFALKGRPADRRIAWLVADLDQAIALGLLADDRARQLAEAFWPGGLTVVLPVGRDAARDLGATLGVRSPDHPTARDLLRRTGPLPTSSANPHGQPECHTTDAVLAAFAGNPLLDAVIEGRSPGGSASSVVDLSLPRARLLRAGAVPRRAIEGCIGPLD